MGNNQHAEAVKSFDLSIANATDKRLEATAQYWKGEAYYKLGDYDKAVSAYKRFPVLSRGDCSGEYALVQYNRATLILRRKIM
jgi:tetratricopeptide (TPR) repeat protein